MAPIKPRLALILLIGSVLACSVFGFGYWEEAHPNYHVCVRSCRSEGHVDRFLACHARCRLTREKDPERARRREEEKEEHDPWDRERREERRHREQQTKEEEEDTREELLPYHHDPEERARERERQEREERQREPRRPCGSCEREKQREKHHNPYHLSSDTFETRFQNEHGRIRVLQRFDQISKQLRGLREFRVVEFESKPETLILPHHSDADYLLVVHSGRAIFTIVFLNNRESYEVEQGDFLRIPAGAITYAANRDNNQNLRIIKLSIPLNIPGQFENFYPSGNRNPESYYKAFSRETLEATFNAKYDEIERVLFGEQGQEQKGREQSSGEGAIVKLSREQLRELSRHASSGTRGGKSSKVGPFNLTNISPRYSNNHGKFWEACPREFPLLQDLNMAVNFADLNEGSLFLPHFNTRAIIIAYVADGQGGLEIACPHLASQRSEQESEQEEEEQSEGQIQRVSAKLSKGDVFIIPVAHPVALRASRNNRLRVVGFALNALNNQRNFLAGERDNVMNQIEREVKGVAFQGSGQQVERLFRNQRESYFVNTQNQQEGGRREGRRAPLSSILGAFL